MTSFFLDDSVPELAQLPGIGFRLSPDEQATLPGLTRSSRIQVTFEDEPARFPVDGARPTLFFISPPKGGDVYSRLIAPIRGARSNAAIIVATRRRLPVPQRTALLRLGVADFICHEDSGPAVREILWLAVARQEWLRSVARQPGGVPAGSGRSKRAAAQYP